MIFSGQTSSFNEFLFEQYKNINSLMGFEGPLFALSIMIIEIFAIKYIQKKEIPWREIVFNLNSGQGLMWFFRAIELLCFATILKYFSFNIVNSWNLVYQIIFTFFAWDLCFYWLHRLHHKIPLLWSVHVVHHEGEHYGLSLGIRNSWYSSLASIPFFLILAVIGVPIEVFIGISSFHYGVQLYNHNNIVNKSGFLESFMTTPSLHRVHHGINPMYIDTNFGGTLNFWDRMFGTAQKELDDVQIVYGVKDSIKTDNPFWASNIPVLNYLKMNVPKIKRDKESMAIVSDLFIATGGILSFTSIVYYIYHLNIGMTGFKQFIFLMLTIVATIALGAASDGKEWGVKLWIFTNNILFVALIIYYGLFDIAGIFVFSLLFLHGLYGVKYILPKNNNGSLNKASI